MAQLLSIKRLRRSDRTAEEPSPTFNAAASAGVRKKRLSAASKSIAPKSSNFPGAVSHRGCEEHVRHGFYLTLNV